MKKGNIEGKAKKACINFLYLNHKIITDPVICSLVNITVLSTIIESKYKHMLLFQHQNKHWLRLQHVTGMFSLLFSFKWIFSSLYSEVSIYTATLPEAIHCYSYSTLLCAVAFPFKVTAEQLFPSYKSHLNLTISTWPSISYSIISVW